MSKKFEKGKMVPVPSHAIIPERDIDKSPILECSHLGIDFGGLRAVNDFNLTIGRTEIAGLIGPNGAGKTTIFNLLTKVYQPTRAPSCWMDWIPPARPQLRSTAWALPGPSRTSACSTTSPWRTM